MSHSIVIDAIGAVAVLMVPLTAFGLQDLIGNQTSPARVETVEIQPGDFHFARAGEFLVGGRPTAAVPNTVAFDRPVEIMKFQVRFADYQACVVDDGCAAPAASETSADVPVTGVSYLDALAYAAWYSGATGETWRLPTDAE
jgi:formylglycine-generating enzyme required for sulfatase activity